MFPISFRPIYVGVDILLDLYGWYFSVEAAAKLSWPNLNGANE